MYTFQAIRIFPFIIPTSIDKALNRFLLAVKCLIRLPFAVKRRSISFFKALKQRRVSLAYQHLHSRESLVQSFCFALLLAKFLLRDLFGFVQGDKSGASFFFHSRDELCRWIIFIEIFEYCRLILCVTIELRLHSACLSAAVALLISHKRPIDELDTTMM